MTYCKRCGARIIGFTTRQVSRVCARCEERASAGAADSRGSDTGSVLADIVNDVDSYRSGSIGSSSDYSSGSSSDSSSSSSSSSCDSSSSSSSGGGCD